MKFFLKSITFFSVLFLFTSHGLSKSMDAIYSEKNISNYFSGIISMNLNNTDQAFKFFKKVKILKDHHSNFNSHYLRTLVLLEKFDQSFDYAKKMEISGKNLSEANLLMGLNKFIKKDYSSAEKYFKKMDSDFYDFYQIKNFLITLTRASKKDKSGSLKYLKSLPKNLNSLKKIQESLIHCHFDSKDTVSLFQSLTNNKNYSYSRYNFFLVNYLLHKNDISLIKKIISENSIDFETNILLSQTKEFIDKNKNQEIKNLFNCQNEKDLMAEFFYIIANLYSAENDFMLSNFYLKISLFLNERFLSNKLLLGENYHVQKKYKDSKRIYESIKKIGEIYSWYGSKQVARIYFAQDKKTKATNYLENEIKKLNNPSYSNYYDLANFLKANQEYKKAIEYYSLSLKKIEPKHHLISDIMENRGGSYERLGMWNEGERDLKESLRLLPDQPYVLNYLAYSWLEKKINIREALEMLEKANEIKQDDGYIIDSLGWGFYLTQDYIKAEKLMRRAIELIPFDPVISDHYGDILWKLNKNIQARYFWAHALKLEKSDKEFIDNVGQKLIFGLIDKS